MRKSIFFIFVVYLLAACNSAEPETQTTVDTSASRLADSIKNAVENSLKDTLLNPIDSVKSLDSIRK